MPTDSQRRNLASAHHAEVQGLTGRIAALTAELEECQAQRRAALRRIEDQGAELAALESDASMFRFMLDNDCDCLIQSDCRGVYLPQGEPLKDYLRAAITRTQETP